MLLKPNYLHPTGASVDTTSYFGADESQLASLQSNAQKPILPSLTANVVLSKNIRPAASLVAASRAEPVPKPISTPALAMKIKSIMTPDDFGASNEPAPISLSRRLFETPSTPADSMIGIAASSPLWAPGKHARPAPQPIAVSFPDLTSTRSSRTTTTVTNPTTTAVTSTVTPARSSSTVTAPPPVKSVVPAASPKRRVTTSTAKSTSATAKSSSSVAPGPTPRRTVSSLASTTSGSSSSSSVAATPVTSTAKVNTRVMPARASKAKSTGGMPAVTPIASSLPSQFAATAKSTSNAAAVASTPTTPPVGPAAAVTSKTGAPAPKAAPAGPPALPTHRTRSQQFKMTSQAPSTSSRQPDEPDDLKPLPALSFATGSTPAAATATNTTQKPSSKTDDASSAIFKQPLFKTTAAPKATSTTDGSIKMATGDSPTESDDDEFLLSSSLGATKTVSSLATTGTPNPDDDGNDDNGTDNWLSGMTELLGLLRKIGDATKKMEFFECRGAISEFAKLPILVKSSPYVLASIGRCYYEMTDQERARESFSRLRIEWPFVKSNMDLYSNVLWHLRLKSDLSSLAHHMMKLEPHSADSWCAMGNAFSLEGDSENAINAFQRAAQVNPDHAYAYTLAGHEYLNREDFESTRASFLESVKVDSRHYRGWYGLGLMYFRMNEFDQAKAYFKKAHLIFPKSSVIYAWMAMCEAILGDPRQAVIHLKTAVSLSPENTKAKYHLASMLVSVALLDRELGFQAAFSTNLQAAERLLGQLKLIIPRSAALHFLNARILTAQGKKDEAEQECSVARELDPKILEHLGEHIVTYDPPEIA